MEDFLPMIPICKNITIMKHSTFQGIKWSTLTSAFQIRITNEETTMTVDKVR